MRTRITTSSHILSTVTFAPRGDNNGRSKRAVDVLLHSPIQTVVSSTTVPFEHAISTEQFSRLIANARSSNPSSIDNDDASSAVSNCRRKFSFSDSRDAFGIDVKSVIFREQPDDGDDDDDDDDDDDVGN